MKIFNYVLATLALCIIGTSIISAQGSSMTPYSKYGYGMLGDYAIGAQRSMGGVGIAQNNSRQINVQNPASYCAMDSLTFLWDIGLSLTHLNSKEGISSDGEARSTGKSTGGGLDYIAMQVPLINKRLAASVGLLPFSSVGYAFGNEIQHGTSSFEGYGGLNLLYLGLSGSPFKNFSIGFNIGYLWGMQVNDIYAFGESSTLFEDVVRIKNWDLTIGAQYNININRKNRVTLGFTYQPGKTLHGEAWGIKYDTREESLPDTVYYGKMNSTIGKDYKPFEGTKLKYTTPHSFGAGISYTYDNRINAEVDFNYAKWSKAEFSSVYITDKGYFRDRWRIAAGFQYQANPRGNWLQRLTIRTGFHYTNDYIQIFKDTDFNGLNEIGASLGFGIPTPSQKTIVNLGFEYKHRDTKPMKLVTENYFCITLGVTFNELWFWRNKIQ